MWNTDRVSTVQSVERAFAVLRCLATGPAGVSEIAERTSLPKSTVSRLLATLAELDAGVQIDPNGAYGLGELILDLSASATPGRNLVGIARPVLEDLVELLGEAAGIGVLDGPSVYYLDQVNGDHEVQVRDWTGERVDAHVVSAGLVLLAHAPASVRARFLGAPLASYTDHSITDPVRLSHRLDETRRAGFAWVFEELSIGLNSVAAVVPVPGGGRVGIGRRRGGRDSAAHQRTSRRPPRPVAPNVPGVQG
jgi:IclR family transcriptional regulator, acetate operon repressor